MMYNWDIKIPHKEKKTIIVRNTNLVRCLRDCLFCLYCRWLSCAGSTRAARFPLATPPPPQAEYSAPGILRIALRTLPYYFTARYSTHDQCGKWNNSDFSFEILYFTHKLYELNCIKYILEKSIFFLKYKTFIDEILAIVLSESIKVVYPPRRLRIPGNTELEKQNTILHNIGHSWKTMPAS